LRILGIDPGIATVGFGVIDADRGKQKYVTCGIISTPAHTALSSRLDQIYTDLAELFDSLRPDAISIEELFFNTNITTGIAVAHGRGVILLAAYRHKIPVYEYTPLQVKQAVVGYGRAEKKQVIDMVRRILSMPSPPKPDDAADALAMAICCAHCIR
jgi:crossover junction endodeoxyribonuclease RuvC